VRRALRPLPAVVLLTLACLPTSAAAHAKPQIVDVTITDTRCSVTPAQVNFGNTHFVVVNRGRRPHGFAFTGHRTGWLARGQESIIDIDFLKPGRYRYFCTTPGRTSTQGRFVIATTPAASESNEATLTAVTKVPGPVTIIAAPPEDETRLVVGQLDGLVHLFEEGALRARPFLDLRSLVVMEGEKGLLGLAFAPDFTRSGLLYAYYSDRAGNLRLTEFRRSVAEPDTFDLEGRRELLEIAKFAPNHNGGMLQFGSDGYLYVSVGDGGDGPGHRLGETGQTLDDLFGAILRIDPRAQTAAAPYGIPADNPFATRAEARPEIWAYGLRNPWRSWLDPVTGDMYIADAGASARDEIDRLPAGTRGVNFGWPCFEGTVGFATDFPVTCPDAVAPIYEYGQEGGRCAIIGGVVARDSRLPALESYFLFSDLCDGHVHKLSYENGFALVRDLGLIVPAPTTFGVDTRGRVFVGSATGEVWRLDPKE
jgi:glucose/arabinose dehydrogenase